MDLSAAAPDLRDWLPYRVDLRPDVPELHWCHTAGQRLARPFFDEELHDLLGRPFNRVVDVVTPIDVAERHLAEHPPLSPTAFVLHSGRCGSTLAARLLAADPRHRVLREPAPFDTVLQVPAVRPVTVDDHDRWLRTALGTLGQPAAGQERLFVKLDAPAACWSGALHRAFPEVPWLVLFRDPVEVAVSLLALPSAASLPSMASPWLTGLTLAEAVQVSPEEHVARVVGGIMDALAASAPRAWVLEHPDLPDGLDGWLHHLGIPIDDAVLSALADITGHHAKFPSQPFTDDRAAKQDRATPELRALVDRFAGPAYTELRRVRAQQTDG